MIVNPFVGRTTIIYHDTDMCQSQSPRKIEAFEGLNRGMVDQKIFHEKSVENNVNKVLS